MMSTTLMTRTLSSVIWRVRDGYEHRPPARHHVRVRACADLPTVLELADVVELSFVRSAADIARLFTALDQLAADSRASC
jgi:hypothetical protein